MGSKNQSKAIISILTCTSVIFLLIHAITVQKARHMYQTVAAFDILTKLALIITCVMIVHNISGEGDSRYVLLLAACSYLMLILACFTGFSGSLTTKVVQRASLNQDVGFENSEADPIAYWNEIVGHIEAKTSIIQVLAEMWDEILGNLVNKDDYDKQVYYECLLGGVDSKNECSFVENLDQSQKDNMTAAYNSSLDATAKKNQMKYKLGYFTNEDDPVKYGSGDEWEQHIAKYAKIEQEFQEDTAEIEVLTQVEAGFELGFEFNLIIFLVLTCWVLSLKYAEIAVMVCLTIALFIGNCVVLGIKLKPLATKLMATSFYALVIAIQLEIMVLISRMQKN